MLTHESRLSAKLLALESAILALLRDGQEEGIDGMFVDASVNGGVTSIDLTYTSQGQPVSGQSL